MQYLLKGHILPVWSLVKINDTTIASSSADYTIRIWDLVTKKEIAIYEGHSRPVWRICMYDESVLASGGEDCLVKLWDTNMHAVFKTLIAHS